MGCITCLLDISKMRKSGKKRYCLMCYWCEVGVVLHFGREHHTAKHQKLPAISYI